MKATIMACCFLIGTTIMFAQTELYNSTFEKSEADGLTLLEGETIISTYHLKNQKVIEYYDKRTKELIFFETDLSQIDVNKLRWVKSHKKLKKLLKEYPPKVAACIWKKKLTIGLHKKEVILIIGNPNETKYDIDGYLQIEILTYTDRYRLKFKENRLTDIEDLSVIN